MDQAWTPKYAGTPAPRPLTRQAANLFPLTADGSVTGAGGGAGRPPEGRPVERLNGPSLPLRAGEGGGLGFPLVIPAQAGTQPIPECPLRRPFSFGWLLARVRLLGWGERVTPHEFVGKWGGVELKERLASQSHFNDLCALLGVPGARGQPST